MKITCSRDHLVERLGVAARGSSTRGSMQVTAGVRISVVSTEEPGELAATDLELSVRTPFDVVEVDEPGVVVLPAKLLQDVLRALRSDRVTIGEEPGGSRVRITAGSGEYAVHAYPVDDFPRLPEIDHERTFAIKADVFAATLEPVARAASSDESRPVLTGVLVHIEPGRLTMAATDSYRLAVKESPLEDPVPEALEAIVPARALQEVARLLGSATELLLLVEENAVAFGIDGTWLTARRIHGQFPNFRALIPTTFDHEVRLPGDEFREVARRVGLFADSRVNAPIRLRLEEGQLVVAAQTPDVGEAREGIPTAFTGEPLEVGFNVEYLRDGLDALRGEEVRLRASSPLRPVLMSGPGDDYSYLIMPIRLS